MDIIDRCICCPRMSDEVASIRLKFELLRPVMDGRMTRLWAATEARALGFGGGEIVTAATGIRGKRDLAGKRDLDRNRGLCLRKPSRATSVFGVPGLAVSR